MYLISFLFILIFNLSAFGSNKCLINFVPQYKYYKNNPNTVSTLFTKSDYQVYEKVGGNNFSVVARLSGEGYIYFKMILRHDKEPQRSPSLASGQKFFDAIMEYFSNISKQSFSPINGVYGEWTAPTANKSSDNYNIFQQALNDYMKRFRLSKEEAAPIAAFDTWTGKQAQRYGFENVSILKLEDNYIKVLFSR